MIIAVINIITGIMLMFSGVFVGTAGNSGGTELTLFGGFLFLGGILLTLKY